MKPVEYFNGNCNIMVQPVSYLLNPSQDFANSMATGPQDELYTALNRFNSHLPDNVKLAVTPSWNWRPGTIPKFREHIHNSVLKTNIKASSLSHMLRRAREQSRYFQYWERQLGEIESLKYSLKDCSIGFLTLLSFTFPSSIFRNSGVCISVKNLS